MKGTGAGTDCGCTPKPSGPKCVCSPLPPSRTVALIDADPTGRPTLSAGGTLVGASIPARGSPARAPVGPRPSGQPSTAVLALSSGVVAGRAVESPPGPIVHGALLAAAPDAAAPDKVPDDDGTTAEFWSDEPIHPDVVTAKAASLWGGLASVSAADNVMAGAVLSGKAPKKNSRSHADRGLVKNSPIQSQDPSHWGRPGLSRVLLRAVAEETQGGAAEGVKEGDAEPSDLSAWSTVRRESDKRPSVLDPTSVQRPAFQRLIDETASTAGSSPREVDAEALVLGRGQAGRAALRADGRSSKGSPLSVTLMAKGSASTPAAQERTSTRGYIPGFVHHTAAWPMLPTSPPARGAPPELWSYPTGGQAQEAEMVLEQAQSSLRIRGEVGGVRVACEGRSDYGFPVGVGLGILRRHPGEWAQNLGRRLFDRPDFWNCVGWLSASDSVQSAYRDRAGRVYPPVDWCAYGRGSAFLVGPGLVMTAYHVVDGWLSTSANEGVIDSGPPRRLGWCHFGKSISYEDPSNPESPISLPPESSVDTFEVAEIVSWSYRGTATVDWLRTGWTEGNVTDWALLRLSGHPPGVGWLRLRGHFPSRVLMIGFPRSSSERATLGRRTSSFRQCGPPLVSGGESNCAGVHFDHLVVGGYSGGPVLDDDGFVVGIAKSSTDTEDRSFRGLPGVFEASVSRISSIMNQSSLVRGVVATTTPRSIRVAPGTSIRTIGGDAFVQLVASRHVVAVWRNGTVSRQNPGNGGRVWRSLDWSSTVDWGALLHRQVFALRGLSLSTWTSSNGLGHVAVVSVDGAVVHGWWTRVDDASWQDLSPGLAPGVRAVGVAGWESRSGSSHVSVVGVAAGRSRLLDCWWDGDEWSCLDLTEEVGAEPVRSDLIVGFGKSIAYCSRDRALSIVSHRGGRWRAPQVTAIRGVSSMCAVVTMVPWRERVVVVDTDGAVHQAWRESAAGAWSLQDISAIGGLELPRADPGSGVAAWQLSSSISLCVVFASGLSLWTAQYEPDWRRWRAARLVERLAAPVGDIMAAQPGESTFLVRLRNGELLLADADTARPLDWSFSLSGFLGSPEGDTYDPLHQNA